MIELSIIIPVYNTEKYIGKCIESIKTSKSNKFEVLIIDDGSTDHSSLIIKNEISNDVRFNYFYKKNTGVSDTRNFGIQKANGKYLWFVDSDDYIEENFVDDIIKYIQKNENDIYIIGYNIIKNNKKQTITYQRLLKRNTLDELIIGKTFGTIGGYPWNKIVKKSSIINLYDPNIKISEDIIFWISNEEYINNIDIVTMVGYNYLIRNNSAMRSGKIENYLSHLDANIIICNMRPQYSLKFMLEYEYIYVNAKFKIIKENIDINTLEKYNTNYELFYKELIKNRKVNIKDKVKLFIMHNMWYFYYKYKKYKSNKI